MRSRGNTTGPWALPLVLLLLPPVGNLVRDLQLSRTARERMALLGLTAADPTAGIEAARLGQLLLDKDRELQLLRGAVQAQPRYAPLRAEPIHLGDLSPRRDAFWIWAEGFPGVTPRTAVTYRGELIGRVERVFRDLGLARVQTLKDSYYRVRFRYRQATGFLWGTGETDDQGRPLLEIRHLSAEVGFREGETVATEGDDGRYPRGLPIGVLVRRKVAPAVSADPPAEAASAGLRAGPEGGEFRVRGEFRLDWIPEVVLLADRAEGAARAAQGKEDAE